MRGIYIISQNRQAIKNEPPNFADIGRFMELAGDDLLWGTLWYVGMELGHWPRATLRGKVNQIIVK